MDFFKNLQIPCCKRVKLLGSWRGVPVFAIVVEPEPNLCTCNLRRLDAFGKKFVVLVLRVLQKIQLRGVVQMRRLDCGVLQHDLVHPERVQALVHVRDRIQRVVGSGPARIEHTRDSCGMNCAGERPRYKRKRSAQKRGNAEPGCATR